MPDVPEAEQISTRMDFVASYPKSGNTWIRMVCGGYGLTDRDLGQFVEYDDIGQRHFQAVTRIPISQIGIGVEAQLRPSAMFELAVDLNLSDGPSLVKSHHACCEANGIHLWSPQWTRKVVNVVRDPRDICCSAKDHFGMDTYEEAAEFMNKESATIGGDRKLHHVLGTWSEHVKSWINTDRVPVHTVKYETLQKDTLGSFNDILSFLGVEVETEPLEDAVEAYSFDRMQKLEQEAGFPEQSEHQDQFFRKGEAGGWREELPSDVAEKIESDHRDMMQHFNYL